jgi:hypothetical protein
VPSGLLGAAGRVDGFVGMAGRAAEFKVLLIVMRNLAWRWILISRRMLSALRIRLSFGVRRNALHDE